jgi:hypothetical protein
MGMQQRRVKNYTGRGGGLGAKAGPPVHTYLRQPTKILWCVLSLPPWRRTSTKAKECVGSQSFAQILRSPITHQRQRIRWLALVYIIWWDWPFPFQPPKRPRVLTFPQGVSQTISWSHKLNFEVVYIWDDLGTGRISFHELIHGAWVAGNFFWQAVN